MAITYSQHALQQAHVRCISFEEIERAIRTGRRFPQRKGLLECCYSNLKIIVERRVNCLHVVTAMYVGENWAA